MPRSRTPKAILPFGRRNSLHPSFGMRAGWTKSTSNLETATAAFDNRLPTAQGEGGNGGFNARLEAGLALHLAPLNFPESNLAFEAFVDGIGRNDRNTIGGSLNYKMSF